ncbi:MAG: formate dehydrogenase accessory sulfurtransferase FdhD [Calditrichaeota bacterium]|nr:MAG: formate dehydrogenase accessory sulfurtransferase FdhD [Calditrichota bacterium]
MQTGQFRAQKFESDAKQTVDDTLTIEAPLQININSRPFSITMRTPGDDLHLVRGLLYTENIYTLLTDNFSYQERVQPETNLPYSANFLTDSTNIDGDFENRRSILSVSSCGICGKKELTDLMSGGTKLRSNYKLSNQTLLTMFEKMNQKQKTFNQSGGSHAAAAFADNGELLNIKEDIGRHNAVDKVIGCLLSDKKIVQARVLLISGRISFEIVTKAFMAKIPILAAVSAPSSLAVKTAEQLGITLAAFCRNNRATIYSHISRITEGNEECLTI